MMTLKAYAKINFGLRILRKREDGYHDIETIFHHVNIYDEITLKPSSDIVLSCLHPDVPSDETNLCVRAAMRLREKYKVHEGVKIELKKNIPVGAGLGGGSSDAASTLLGLNELWELHCRKEELHEVALPLGSDVPFFLNKGSAYATGRGDILEYLNLDLPYWIVIAHPTHIHISTAWAYQHVEIQNLPAKRDEIRMREVLPRHINNPHQLSSLLHNDFELLIFQTYKAVAEIKQSLVNEGAVFAQMSGTGSSVYGLFSDEQRVKTATEELQKKYRVFITPPHFEPQIPIL